MNLTQRGRAHLGDTGWPHRNKHPEGNEIAATSSYLTEQKWSVCGQEGGSLPRKSTESSLQVSCYSVRGVEVVGGRSLHTKSA